MNENDLEISLSKISTRINRMNNLVKSFLKNASEFHDVLISISPFLSQDYKDKMINLTEWYMNDLTELGETIKELGNDIQEMGKIHIADMNEYLRMIRGLND